MSAQKIDHLGIAVKSVASAKGFYEKLGYRTVGVIEDCPVGTTTRWYRKDL